MDQQVPEGAIAVVGMSGRFPGAPDLAAYWANLRGGVCSLTDFDAPAGEVGTKGLLADADRFEADLFGFHRTEAAALDPQHRLLLETAWAALEDAGYDPLRAPARTGVYVGGSPTEHALAAATGREPAARIGATQVRLLTDREFLAPWISYRLGLDGPSMNVQTACSTSLTAVHLAAQALLLGECDTALAGGVSVDAVRPRGYVHVDGGIYAPDGRCRPFDEKAAGTVPGNGVGVVVLRRLEDALADGDPVRAVLRGSAVTNDGATKVGFTAPGVDRQTAAIAEAWEAAGLDPARVQYLEAHGTGTELGDRIELAAAGAAFAGASGVRLGSVKSNIGHLDAAAGVAALIKTVLMLEHGALAPTVNVESPHPDLESSPFRLVTEAGTVWPRPADGSGRLAGVTSVGIGGTNVHVVLEEAPPRPAPAPAPAGGPFVLPLSARTEGQLQVLARRLAEWLRAEGAPSSLAEVAHTLRTGRTALPVRTYVVASGPAEAAEKLAAGVRDPHPLGEAWLAGGEVAWPEAPEGTRRVSLPTYPFAGESHGALTLERPVQQPAAAEADPEGDLQAAVAGALREALGLDASEAALDRTYFEAGGDSLTAVHLVSRMSDEFGVDVPIDLFLEQLTLAELAARIVELRSGDDELGALLDEFESEA
ncbi:beta-ketoacyl synthase N-terminal-like domain-containing protein [Streptomyces sp. NPDC045431]|uniref:beta-ketoacyl synthase N-terminal-like domain-containing protein n=1 Tax=Streptomyces sp. NPDC045431 TaxID=3155613 RepID=UPI0033C6385B